MGRKWLREGGRQSGPAPAQATQVLWELAKLAALELPGPLGTQETT